MQPGPAAPSKTLRFGPQRRGLAGSGLSGLGVRVSTCQRSKVYLTAIYVLALYKGRYGTHSCVRVCACEYMCMHACMHACTYVYVYIYAHMSVYVYAYVYVYVGAKASGCNVAVGNSRRPKNNHTVTIPVIKAMLPSRDDSACAGSNAMRSDVPGTTKAAHTVSATRAS